MGLITISGLPGCRTEEVARITAQLLGFELVTESRLTTLVPEEFRILEPVPERAWRDLMLALSGPLAAQHQLILCFDGAEQLASEFPGALRVHIVAPEGVRAGNLMVDRRLERAPARACLAELERERKSIWKKRFGRVSAGLDAYDLVLNTASLSSEAAAALIERAARSLGLGEKDLLSATAASHLEFRVRLRLARHGITPVGRIDLAPKPFVNASEEIFANLLDFYRIAWEYEPKSFPIQWNKEGHVSEAFTPDFYLPEFDLYVELTTMKQAHVTKKNRKVRLLREIYPHVNIQVFYQKDFENLMFKYGLVRDSGQEALPHVNEDLLCIEKVLFTEEQIEARIVEVAAEIEARYRGRSLKMIGVLKGSFFFLAALARRITIPLRIDFLGISSFSNKTGAPGLVRISKDLDDSIEGEDVLLVEDIVDTGFTLRYLLQTLAGRGPNSLAVCTFLDRTSRRIVQVPVDFRCFEIPDRFVIGFGLDYNQLYRNLNYVAVMSTSRETSS